jgi:hypothetical protein
VRGGGGWITNFRGCLGQLTEIDSLPLISTVGPRKLKELSWAAVGSAPIETHRS